MYKILQYSYKQAKKIGVIITPSDSPKFKINVYSINGILLTRLGSTGYGDYPTYILTHGQEFADNRRRLYKLRHERDRHIVYSRGWLVDNILW